MEAGSDEESPIRNGSGGGNTTNENVNGSNDGAAKPKRQMKTPFQLETLEKVYSVETYPSEATRAELSEKLGLSDRQLQMWFCHRRLKDKKEAKPKKQRKAAPFLPPPPGSPVPDPDSVSGSGSGSGSGCSPYRDSRKVFASGGSSSSRAALGDYETSGSRHYESRQSIMELRAIACVEAQLGEPLREDGPILGMEFDALPPGAFGAPIEKQKHSSHSYESKLYERHDSRPTRAAARNIHDHQFLQDQSFRSDAYGHREVELDAPRGRTSSFAHGVEPSSRLHGVHGIASRARSTSQQAKSSPIFSSAHESDNILLERESFTDNRLNASPSGNLILGSEDAYVLSDGVPMNNDVHRKGKNDEVRSVREIEFQESRMRKELEKLEIQRKKNEERMRKEMERQERERRKEEERLMRERQKEEERSLREQRREMERREKFLQKEYQRAEKKRQKEELRREKEEVRRKIAIEKATARKIAKESMDLIEDEQLELMELAAANKGLPSILHLDHDTLQNLELFKDSLSTFPPSCIQLKRPFAIQPWNDSEENVGNLLMVWRFLISFADVLGLWPFTLDEFVQAFHDYDSRLLGEIHIALLKSIIRDIQDVARTPFAGSGINQHFAANPEGGHPQIVEGAYAWGFDIRNWQKHLNPLTWPEILRQLALSAGFGPCLKKNSSQWTHPCENDEGRGCDDVLSTLRNGSAAQSAFALMREKGLLAPRKSRHRLTPGTVKFAAFHVLSLEGSDGLTVLELADKIQKSGLRDLTTSKTPEASISVALTRDVKLFERIAPSTYCVRTPYRKDPADAEAILAEARKKIRAFENGFTGGEDVEDVERDEDFECDVDEDPEVDDLATPSNATKSANDHNEVNKCSESGKDNISSNVAINVQNELGRDLSSLPSSSTDHANILSAGTAARTADDKSVEVDESNSGESWVQGLTEGDYSHLSVEERLNALVALIGVANEGNSTRGVLEDRMEAANSLKKQMWAEAQMDKSRMRDIIKLDVQSMLGSRSDPRNGIPATEIVQSPSRAINTKNETSSSHAEDHKPPEMDPNDLNNYTTGKTTVIQDTIMGPDNLSTQHGYASKRSRSQLKSYIGHKAEEMYAYRSLPLGQDRRRNRYWQFAASASRNDPSCARIFVELQDGRWRLIDTEEAFEDLVASLDMRGIRESHLRIMLQKIEASFKENVGLNLKCSGNHSSERFTIKNEGTETDSSPDYPVGVDSPGSAVCGLNSDTPATSHSFRVEVGRNDTEKENLLKRYQDFQRWIWSECYNSLPSCARKYGKNRCAQLLTTCALCLDSYFSESAHCSSCHQSLGTVSNNFERSEHSILCEENKKVSSDNIHLVASSLPLGIRLLKALLSFIEASVPAEALESFWTEDQRKRWGMKLNMSSSCEEILQVVTLFESAIKREYLSSNFETTKELLGTGSQSGSADDLGSVPVLPWIPQNASALVSRVLDLDASIKYIKEEKSEITQDREAKQYAELPSRCPTLESKDIELREAYRDVTMKEANLTDLSSRRNTKRGRGGSEPASGRKLQRKKTRGGLKPDSSGRNGKANENLAVQLRQQGRGINNQACGRGRRTVRKRADRRTIEDNNYLGGMADIIRPKSNEEESFRNLEEEWIGEPSRMMHGGGGYDSSNSMEGVESDDNDQAVEYEQGNWELGYEGTSNAWNANLNEASDDDGDDASGDDNRVEDVGGEDLDDEIEMSESSEAMVKNGGRDDEGESESSEDYSDS